MWQRNDTGHVQDVAAEPTPDHPGLRPFSVAPGEVVDFPFPLAGFTEVEAGAAPEPAAPKPTRKRAEQAPAPEGDES